MMRSVLFGLVLCCVMASSAEEVAAQDDLATKDEDYWSVRLVGRWEVDLAAMVRRLAPKSLDEKQLAELVKQAAAKPSPIRLELKKNSVLILTTAIDGEKIEKSGKWTITKRKGRKLTLETTSGEKDVKKKLFVEFTTPDQFSFKHNGKLTVMIMKRSAE